MGMKRRNTVLMLGILALVCVIAFAAAAETEGDEERGTRAEDTYVGSEVCKGCHNTAQYDYVYDTWNDTSHGIDFAHEWERRGEITNKYTTEGGNDDTGEIGECASCHVVGYNKTDIGGFDPALPWNDSYNEPLLRIGCENCHGPGSAHVPSTGGLPSKSTINLGPDRYFESCAGTADAGCHGNERQYGNDDIHGWSSSIHAPFENDPEEDGGMNTYCARCKSPSQYDPEATRNTAEDISAEDFRGITCGDCHDPHNDTGHVGQLRWDEEEICEVCHEGSHGTMRNSELDDEPTVDRDKYPYMEEVACVDCHMFSTGHGTPEEFALQGHSFEATIEACLSCHSDIYDNMPDDEYPHENWTDWEEDFTKELEAWREVVETQQYRHREMINETGELLDKVGGVVSHGHVEEPGLKQAAEENGTWTADMESRLEDATINFELADHASEGAHNPAYGTALLTEVKELLMELEDELSVGILKGKVTDESDEGIADVYISVNGMNGMGTKTGTDGSYSLEVAGTYTVSAYKHGTIEQEFSDVVITAPGITWQNFTLAADFDCDGEADSSDTDDDNDGLPDTWEDANGLDSKDPTDAGADDDGDGMTNTQEYAEEKNPQVADKEEATEETGSTMYLALIIVLIVVIVIMGLMMVKKGGSSPKPEEPHQE